MSIQKPDRLAKVTQHGDFFHVYAWARTEWCLLMILTDERLAYAQADRWHARLTANPTARMRWTMDDNLIVEWDQDDERAASAEAELEESKF
jgi:hypothetical protein